MAIIQSYRGNAKNINLRVRRNIPIVNGKIEQGKPPSRRVKLLEDKQTKDTVIRVKRHETE